MERSHLLAHRHGGRLHLLALDDSLTGDDIDEFTLTEVDADMVDGEDPSAFGSVKTGFTTFCAQCKNSSGPAELALGRLDALLVDDFQE